MRKAAELKIRMLGALGASLPIIVLFLLVPIHVYNQHAAALDLSPASVTYCVIVGLGLTGLIATAFVIARNDQRVIASRLALVGLALLSFHFLRPTGWNLNDPTSILATNRAAVLLDGSLLTLLAILGVRIPRWLQNSIGPLVAAICVGVSGWMFLHLNRTPAAVSTSPPMVISRPNIYHFLFDGLATPAFTPTLKSDVGRSLLGFTFFRRNRANYFATDASLPSMLTGTFFTGGDFEAFQRLARHGGIRAELQAKGYQVATYTPDRTRFWHFANANSVTTNQDLARKSFDPSGAISLTQMSIVTSMPPFFRKHALFVLKLIEPGSRYRFYKQNSVELIDRFLSDEATRPARGQYVFVHVLLPHPPYRYDARCKPAPKNASYHSQARCATLLMSRIINQLRSLDHFESSLIIFQSDHGFDRARSQLDSGRAVLPKSVIAAIIDSGDEFNPQEIMERSQALLLVKPVSAPRRPLLISNAPTQLIDIPATIADATGLDLKTGHGVSTRRLTGANARDWHFFTGLKKRGGLFRPNPKGRGIAHISLAPDGRWHLHPCLHASSNSKID